MTNYNLAHYLPETLGAILNQSVRPLEVLVVDDASTDESLRVLAALVDGDPLVRVIRPPRNLGAVGALNYGLGEVRGEYVYHNAADDPLLPGAFEQALAMLAQYPQAAVCAWDHGFLYERTGERRAKPLPWGGQAFYAPAEAVPALLRRAPVGAYQSIVSRHELQRLGGYDPAISYFSDCFAASLVALRGGVCYLPGTWALLRVRDDSYGAVTCRQPPQRRAMLAGMLAAVNSPELADVRDGFRDACLLTCHGVEGILAAARDPRSRDLVTLRLLSRPLLARLNALRERLFPLLPQPVVRVWRRLKRCFGPSRGRAQG